MPVEFRVLGPLSVRRDGREVTHAAAKPRRLLALLLLRAPHLVPAGPLVAELWGDRPPARAGTTLRTHVFHLRTAMARELDLDRGLVARELLQTRDGGYRVVPGGGSFDLPEFHRRSAAARALLGAGDLAAAGRGLARALELWRGPALVDLEHGGPLRAAVAELDRCRLDTVALFLRTQLDLGRHREVVSELAGLAVRHPHHEELHGLLMVALHRSGYRLRALEVFEDLRRSLRDELGVAPSAGLAGLRHVIRAGDPAAAAPAPAAKSAPTRRPAPAKPGARC